MSAAEARTTESVSLTEVHCVAGHVSKLGVGFTAKVQVAFPLSLLRSVQANAETGTLGGPWRSITTVPEVAGEAGTFTWPVGFAGSYTN